MSAHTASLPWYRYPIMWLVVGLPISAVIAGIVTYALILEHPDPVVPHGAQSSPTGVHRVANGVRPPET